jgi:hypothetical protein
VTSYELGGGQKAQGNNSGSGEKHLEPVRWDIRKMDNKVKIKEVRR